MRMNTLYNGHLDTIIPVFFRRQDKAPFVRERIETSDKDFLDLDWIRKDNSNLIILSHGFEGSSSSQYIQGMARHFSNLGFDILAWNFRSCSGEMNRANHFYHSGATYDLRTVIDHSLKFPYKNIFLIGFSMGGNLTLKYLGEESDNLSQKIKGATCFSVPIDLADSAAQLGKGFALRVYTPNFLNSLKPKLVQKEKQLSDLNLQIPLALKTKTLKDFDDLITGPLHGFKDANDYYYTQSAVRIMKKIKCPSLLVNALNDPFLGERCLTNNLFKENKNIVFETPKYGGHVGFWSWGKNNAYWSEIRAERFINNLL